MPGSRHGSSQLIVLVMLVKIVKSISRRIVDLRFAGAAISYQEPLSRFSPGWYWQGFAPSAGHEVREGFAMLEPLPSTACFR